MSYSSPSDEVAQDFAIALEGLNLNNRYEISNLTVIAKENTEHAYAISEALKNHIKQTSPQKKLPAFYVLDSIVKNVGTPYTLFFGRQLYATFMEAYALMDHSTRRKMDEMLKTWKEPVPGSIDRRPVFPPDTTSPIETALIRARTSALEAFQRNQPQMGRGRAMGSAPPYRETPTPPGVVRPQVNAPPGYNSNYAQPQYPPPQPYAPPQQYGTPQPPPNSQHYPHPQQYPGQINGQQQDYGAPQRPPSQQYAQQPVNQSYYSDDGGIEMLKNDIANLITSSKADFAQNYWDTSIQTRLKALLDLQTILLSQRLPPDQIALIKDQLAQLSIAAQQPHKIQNPPVHVPPPAPVAAAPPPVQQPSLESLLGPGALAALLARKPATPQNTPHSQPAPSIRSPPQLPPTATSSTPVPDTNSLLASLRAAGILGNTVPTSTPPISLGSLAGRLPPGFPPPPPMLNTPPSSRTPLAEIPNDVELKANSLKIPRPHLIYSLYQKLGEPCNQCGRRFKTDEEGKKTKVAHLDWHFRVNQGMVEAAARGQHRDWYIDELAWIKWREIDEDQVQKSENTTNGSGGTSSVAAKPKLQYIPVPDDPANSVCPICQEKFSDTWLHDAQEFVWMDAKKVGDRYFHASCYAEATKDSSRINRGTPEPVLGKRKAEDEHITLRSKIKTEPLVQ